MKVSDIITLFLLAYNVSIIPSDPARFNSFNYPMTTVKQMNKLNLSPLAISRIIQNGTKFNSTEPFKCLYICRDTHIAVAVNEVNGEIINVVPKVCPYEFQKQQDASDKRRSIRVK